MASSNPFTQLLPDIASKPPMVSADVFRGNVEVDKEAIKLLKRAGITAQALETSIQNDIKVSYDRFNRYAELSRAAEHWFVGPCLDLYANVATSFNPIHNATCWVTSKNDTYARELNAFLDRIGIEEKIYDWAYSVCQYGDMFVKMNGVPGLGVISVDDSMHPMHLSRVEIDGILVGFYNTPQGAIQGSGSGSAAIGAAGSAGLMPPWEYVHMRLLGAKRKRSRFAGDQTHSEMRQIHMITGAENKADYYEIMVTSVAMNALPAYKRLRLAEDSLLLARVTRGIIKYIWKLKVDSTNSSAVAALMDQYATLITRARSIDTRDASASYDSRQNPMTSIEDLFVPVWGDVNDLAFEKIGGEADIRWIVDIDMLRNQLAFAMACSPSLGGAFTKETSGALGSEAISELGIRFARSARRVQRTLISGITRMCQIHLAYIGFDPDPTMFTVHMSETSTTEETELLKNMESGMKVLQTMLKTLKSVAGKRIDSLKVWDYFNEKLLRLEDFQITDFYKSAAVLAKEQEALRAAAITKQQAEEKPSEEPNKASSNKLESIVSEVSDLFESVPEESLKEAIERAKKRINRKQPVFDLDIYSYCPAYVNLTEEIVKPEEYQDLIEVKGKKNIRKANDSFWIQERDAYRWHKKFGVAKIFFGDIEEESEELAGAAV